MRGLRATHRKFDYEVIRRHLLPCSDFGFRVGAYAVRFWGFGFVKVNPGRFWGARESKYGDFVVDMGASHAWDFASLVPQGPISQKRPNGRGYR
jgi:hypothetical protein